MLRTKLLFLSVLAYASGQGVSYYGSSSVRTQSRLPPRPLIYRPDYAGQSPVYNPQPVYQAPTQLPEQHVSEPQAPQESQQPLRPPQLTYGPLIPQPPVFDPQAESSTPEPKTEAPEIPPQTIYSPIPPHSAIPLQPSSRPLSPRPLPAWSWRPSTPAVVVIEENPTTPSYIVYPSTSPIYTSKSVEPSIESSSQSSVIEEHTSTSEPEEEAVSTSSVSDSSTALEYHDQSYLITESSTQNSSPALEIQVPQTSSPDLIDSPEPLTDPIPEPSSEKPQQVVESVYVSSPQPLSDIQPEISTSPHQSYSYPAPRPLPARPSTSPVFTLESQQIEPEPVKLAEPKPIDLVPSVPSYQPIELQNPISATIKPPSRPNYQPSTPSSPPQPLSLPQISAPAVRPNYYQPPVPAPEPVHIPLSYQPIAPVPVVQPQPPLTPKPYPIQLSQRPAYQPPDISIPLPLAEPVYKPIKPQIPQQSLPVVRPAPIPVPISQPQIPQYPSRPAVPEALPIVPIDDFHCNAGNAYYRVVNECDSYIACKDQRAWKNTCPDGLHFNPNAMYPEYPCSYPSEVKCELTASKQIAQPTSECPNRYGFFALSGDCNRYLMCQEGKASVMNCPFGLVFNNQLSGCDWPENVPQCNLSAFKDFSCPIPPEDDPDFLTRHRYGNDCGMYVACQHGYPRLLKCDLGLSFDEDSQVCIDTDLVENCRHYEARYN